MKKLAIAAGVIALALTAGGCSETLKEWFRRVAPEVACQKEAREYADWVAKGKPIDRGGEAEKEAARKVIDELHKAAVKKCADLGVIIQ